MARIRNARGNGRRKRFFNFEIVRRPGVGGKIRFLQAKASTAANAKANAYPRLLSWCKAESPHPAQLQNAPIKIQAAKNRGVRKHDSSVGVINSWVALMQRILENKMTMSAQKTFPSCVARLQ